MHAPRIRPLYRLAIVALAGVACTDGTTSTAPTATRPVAALSAAPQKPRPRGLYIADLQLGLFNPGSKDYTMIYLKGELKSQNNQPPVPASAFLAYCPFPNGIVPRGSSCTMSDGITGSATLAPGPGTFTLKVLQQQSDGSMTVLDAKTVDVVLRQF